MYLTKFSNTVLDFVWNFFSWCSSSPLQIPGYNKQIMEKLDLQGIIETICYILEMKSLYYERMSIVAMLSYLQSNVPLLLMQAHQLIFSAWNKQPKFNCKCILQNISHPLNMTSPKLNSKFNTHVWGMTQVALQSIHLKPLLLLVITRKL